VGKGGIQNFLKQHKPGSSKACQLTLEKKNKASVHQQSQPGLLSYFTKEPKALVPPAVSIPTPVIAYAMESTSQCSRSHVTEVTPRTALPAPNIHTVNVLAMLEKAVGNLPELPDACESDEIAVFAESIPTDLAREDAWEHLDPMLNRFLGFGKTDASIYDELRGGARGLAAMVQYLKDFTSRYQIDGALLEGKIQRLVNVIKTQCVAITRTKCTHFGLHWTCAARA